MCRRGKEIDVNLDKAALWRELQERFAPVCQADESCWIEDRELMADLRRRHPSVYDAVVNHVFKPRGTKKRFDWLSTTNIDEVMFQYERYFAGLNFVYLGCVPSDFYLLEKFPAAKLLRADRAAIIFNLDSSNQPGSHWVALHMHWDGDTEPVPDASHSIALLKRNGISGGSNDELRDSFETWRSQQEGGDPNVAALTSCHGRVQDLLGGKAANRNPLTLEYFDSTGAKPNRNITKTIDMIRDMFPGSAACRNTMEHQKLNTECGVYSMYFVLQRLEGRSFRDINRERISDAAMNQYRDDLYRPRVNVYQEDFAAIRSD